MTTFIPPHDNRFEIDVESETFIREPPGNTLTVQEVYQAARDFVFPVAPKEQKTTNAALRDVFDDRDVEATDIEDIAGESAYAEIAVVDHITAPPQQTGINSTYVKINQFNSIVRSKNITISGTDNNLTIINPGFYKLEFHFSMTGSTNTNFEISPFVNDLQNGFNSFADDIRHIDTVRKTGTAPGDVGAMSASGIVHLDAGDVVDLRVKTDNLAGANFNVIRANFILVKVR